MQNGAKFPGIPAGIFLKTYSGEFPGIPEWDFLVALFPNPIASRPAGYDQIAW